MIDWKNAEEFKELPLLPEDFTWPELAQVITHQHPGPMHSHVLMDVKIFTTNWEDWQNAKFLYILQIPSLRTPPKTF